MWDLVVRAAVWSAQNGSASYGSHMQTLCAPKAHLRNESHMYTRCAPKAHRRNESHNDVDPLRDKGTACPRARAELRAARERSRKTG
jgi:hypothetical protein